MDKKTCLVFDPIPFKGGSKIATSDALLQSHPQQIFIVATVDPDFWLRSHLHQSHNTRIMRLWLVPALNRQHCGKGYWLNQLWICCHLLFILLWARLSTGNIVTTAVGASGPGIDMPLYILKRLFRIKVMQFIHGDCAASRSIGYCLSVADHVFYLPTTLNSLTQSLRCYWQAQTLNSDAEAQVHKTLQSCRYHPFINGIPKHRWPSRSETHAPRLFWAASLLKWKGLDLFIQAVQLYDHQTVLDKTICYIRPNNIDLEVSQAPVELSNTTWFEDPDNLDAIRAKNSIFVSTSVNEPFGLSILEALAAGMCVVIPEDGAYWDQKLTDGVNCVKYRPNDAVSLANVLRDLSQAHNHLRSYQLAALQAAERYRAEVQYQEFVQYLAGYDDPTSHLVDESGEKSS